ncbi:hypothetical protein HOLleu_34153 [Holothuria leucospilota]|uniref:Uncharacterized protein n=1 Tax=Holothuria leucospilota TaxID=206669 RepID=A0A9Q0YRJ0_HOLLE|nr:hypothetical protein HOLleu_34153 [Holothuria leucospilota]
MGFIDEINTQTVLLSIVERRPSFIQNRRVKQVRNIKKSHGKNPQIDDLVAFVADIAEELNDPVYGKLGTFKTPAHIGLYQKRGGLVKESEKSRSEKSRNFTGIVEMTEAKSCVVCQGNHTFFNCTEFKDKPPPDRFQITSCGRKHTKFLHESYTANALKVVTPSSSPESESVEPEQAQNGLVYSEGAEAATSLGPMIRASDVGVLIGQDVPDAVIPMEIRKGPKGAPYAMRTRLGWTVCGPLGNLSKHKPTSTSVTNEQLNAQVQKFWEVDSNDVLDSVVRGMSVNDKYVYSVWSESVKYIEGH